MRRGAAPTRRRLEVGDTLVEPGDALYLLLDGVLAVEIDGEEIAEIGPRASTAAQDRIVWAARNAAANPARYAASASSPALSRIGPTPRHGRSRARVPMRHASLSFTRVLLPADIQADASRVSSYRHRR
jgi:hypothetical protein